MKWLVIAPVVLLAACATEWKKPGASPQDLAADTQSCVEMAQKAVPVRMMAVGGYNAPSRHECEPKSADGPAVCRTVPGEMIPLTMVDQNQKPRDTAVDNCLKGKGWAH